MHLGAVGAVHMAVLNLLGECLADRLHGDVEVEAEAGHRVVEVNHRLGLRHLNNRADLRAVTEVDEQLLAELHRHLGRQHVAVDRKHVGLVALAVALVGLERELHMVAHAKAEEVALNCREKVLMAVKVPEQVVAARLIHDLALVVREGVGQCCHNIVCNLHRTL